MKRFFIAIAAGVLLMFSCTGNRSGQGGEMPEDSVADSVDTVETDTMELLITQTPMPRAADAMFDDFLFNFLANKRLQKERIVFPLRICIRVLCQACRWGCVRESRCEDGLARRSQAARLR